MASNWAVCGVCDFRNINKASVVWCSECDEGLCGECIEHHDASKSTRNHDTITITEYQKLPSNVLEITQTCPEHKEQYQTFCRKHDCPCCRRCVIETHNDCKDLTAIDDIVHSIKSSNAFLELEQILAEMLENMQQIRNDRQTNINCLQEQKRKIETEIPETRKMINVYLDQLHENLIKELYCTEENANKNIKQLLSVIGENEKGIMDLQFNLTNIKQHASELQTFLALKHIENVVSEKESFIKYVVEGEDMKTKTLSLMVNKETQNIAKIHNFGIIGVESKSCKIVVSGNKNKQAQLMVPITISKGIDDIKLSNKRQINLQAGLIRGCTILPNGKMIFCCQNERKIVALNCKRTHDFEIMLDTAACDIVYIEPENVFAVTSGSKKKFIHIIDLNSRTVKKSIRTSSIPFGVALRNNALVYCESVTGIKEMTLNMLNDECETTLVSVRLPYFSYVAVHDDKIYYTNKENHSVECHNIHGNLEWEFKDTQYPQGISVDSNANMYVAGKNSHNVVVISPDGKHCRKILSANDGLSSPRALHFERKTNKLLVGNECNCAFLYDVS